MMNINLSLTLILAACLTFDLVSELVSLRYDYHDLSKTGRASWVVTSDWNKSSCRIMR